MPCWSQQTSVVEFGPQTDVKLLTRALEALEFRVTVTQDGLLFSKMGASGQFQNGKLTIRSSEAVNQNVFKRAYSTEVVRAASQRFGWQVKQTDAHKFQVTRRA